MCKNTTRPLCSMEDVEYQNVDKGGKGPCAYRAAFKRDDSNDFCAGP